MGNLEQKIRMEHTYYCTYHVSSYDINPSGKARLTALANFLQETAYRHACTLKLGYHDLAKENIAWVLSRMRIRVLKYPVWDEELTIETWPHGIEKLFALRDFRIFNSEGELLAEASINFLMVDTESHRPVRIPPDFIKIEVRSDSVFDSMPGKINNDNSMRLSSVHDVRYSDLDIVGHVNNVKYIEWCSDALDPELLINKGVADFEINFMSEANAGDKVEIFLSEMTDNTVWLSGKNTGTQKECFRAKITF